MNKTGRKDSPMFLPHPLLQAGPAQCQEGTPRLEKVPLARKTRAGRTTSFPSPLRHHMKGPLCFHLNQRLVKLRGVEVAKHKEGKQDVSASESATQSGRPRFRVGLLYRGPQQFSKKTEACSLPQAPYRFHRIPPSGIPACRH